MVVESQQNVYAMAMVGIAGWSIHIDFHRKKKLEKGLSLSLSLLLV